MAQRAVKSRILLVEDDFDVAAGLADYLEEHGVAIDFAYSLREARMLALRERFDVIVLDVQLPDGSGVDFCTDLKRAGDTTPVLLLTALGGLADKLAGSAAGAIDYVVKPFAPAELLARLKALTMQVAQPRSTAGLRLGPYTLDLANCVLRHGEQSLVLSASALRILEALFDASPGTASRDRLVRLLWDDSVPESDPLRMHMHLLRRSLLDAFGTNPVVTERGLGYRFDADRG